MCLAIGGIALLATPAAAQSPAGIVLSEVIRAAPGSTHVAATVAVDPAHVNGSCDVSVIGENNESVHPNTDIFVVSANEVAAQDVERMAGNVLTPADGTLLLGETITVRVRLGPDGVFSGGLLTVSFDCTPPPPPPTTPTTIAPPVTPAGGETPTSTTEPGTSADANTAEPAPAASGTTLPRTGSATHVALPAAGIAALALGAGLLAAERARRDAGVRS
jgi:LPXTG-motif cell wall-anchored protein